jgi:hypothetical protein
VTHPIRSRIWHHAPDRPNRGKRHRTTALIFLLCSALSACGGGSGHPESEKSAASSEILAANTSGTAALSVSESLQRQAHGGLLNAQELNEALQDAQSIPSNTPLRSGQLAALAAYDSGMVAQKASAVRLPVFRFFNTITGTHFYTSSISERDSVIASLAAFRYEGAAFFAASQAAPGLKPVYRFFNTQTGVHFYTISETERADIQAGLPQFELEGVAYYASQVAGTGFNPLYRFFQPRAGTHFYTASESERQRVQDTMSGAYDFEGVGYYVLNNHDAPGYNLAPLGSPRILLADAPTLARLKRLMAVGTPSALRFKNYVDAEMAGANGWGFQPWFAALMGQVTGNASYCSFAVQRTEAQVLAEESLIGQGQRAAVAGDSYLEVGPIIGSLATVMDWCRSTTTAAQRTRWQAYANQAVWNVWHPAQASWGGVANAWSGWSVDNPANNYYYSFLEATMLLGLASHGENPQADTWLDMFRQQKLEQQLFPIFTRDLTGGGSREGTGYGTAMKNLWRLYDWWERSTGERIADRTPHTLASLAHFQHMMVPTLDRLAPTGDHARDSTAALFDYHRDYVQVLMRLFPGERLAATAKDLLARSNVPRMQNGFMTYSDFLYDTSDLPRAPSSDLATAYWGSGTGQFAMRSSWALDDAYANFICGPYTESHAHHDQGSFVIFKGNWLAFDANVASHSGIEQAEGLHNLVRVERNGNVVPQREGAPACEMLAVANAPEYAYGLARITPAYGGAASVVRLEREFVFLKPGTFIVFDRVQTSGGGIRRVFSLNLPSAPTVNGESFSLVQGTHRLDVTRLAPVGLPWQVAAWPGLNPEVLSGVQVDAAHESGNNTDFLHVLDIDGAAQTAVRNDSPGTIGAHLTLQDGRSATVRFSLSGTGGTVEIRASGGQLLSSGALPTGVSAPPLFAN